MKRKKRRNEFDRERGPSVFARNPNRLIKLPFNREPAASVSCSVDSVDPASLASGSRLNDLDQIRELFRTRSQAISKRILK